MDFEVLPSVDISEHELVISLPTKIRLGLGVLVGQVLQFSIDQRELFLKVAHQLRVDQSEGYVSPTIFSLMGSQPLSYKIPAVTLGCDPEFFILLRGNKVSAATYLPFNGQIGCDGELGELRPMYGRHEDQVVRNLGLLIPQIPHQMKRAEWAVGAPTDGYAMTYTGYSYYAGTAAGFHVHLGIPPEILNTREDVSRPVLNYLIKALDWYTSVPLVLLETNNERRCGKSEYGKPEAEYGKPGDYRTTNVTLEYRTPGAFYLRSPALAGGLLGMSLLVIEFMVGRIQEISKNFVGLKKILPEDLNNILPLPNRALVQQALTEPEKKLAIRAYPIVKKSLRALPNYPEHQASIEKFFRIVEEKKIPEADLIPNWEDTK